jgi:sterol desaturase/sphingolipid hydroxylase (fatty acid hydroxylase superfamily)
VFKSHSYNHPTYVSGIHLDFVQFCIFKRRKSLFLCICCTSQYALSFSFVLFFLVFMVLYFSGANMDPRYLSIFGVFVIPHGRREHILHHSRQSAQAGFLSQVIYPKGQQRGERFIFTFAIGRVHSRIGH